MNEILILISCREDVQKLFKYAQEKQFAMPAGRQYLQFRPPPQSFGEG